MIGLKHNCPDDVQWRANVSRNIRRIELIFLLAVILGTSFVWMEIWKIKHELDIKSASNLRKLEDAISSLRDVQDLILLKMNLKVVQPIESKVGFLEDLPLVDRQSRKTHSTGFDSRKKKTPIPDYSGSEAIFSSDNSYSRREETSIFDEKLDQCDELKMLAPSNPFNNFTFDIRIDQILSVFHSISSTDILKELSSPQHKAACWILYTDALRLPTPSEFLVERYILAVLLFSMDQTEMLMQSLATCEYDFVDCDNNGFITKINMRALGRNRRTFKRTIPIELSFFRHLEYLHLTSCSLEGSIPLELGTLKTLRELNLEKNDITGAIPSEMGTLSRLKVLSLMSNCITGTIPSEMARMVRLKVLNLGTNCMTGTIPSEVFDLATLLELNLDNNAFDGTIDPNIRQLESLEKVYLHNNQLRGPIPSEVGELSSLKEMFVGNNSLTGTFPTEISNLNTIESIVVDSNFLTGTMPDIFGNFTKLAALNIEENQFSGSFPESLWNVTFGFGLILQDNLITGTIPEDFCSKKFNLKLDTSSWFRDKPKVSCACCEKYSCYLWNSNELMVEGSERPTCPNSNIQTVEYMNAFKMTDNIAEVSLKELSPIGRIQSMELCLSPTGCYSFFDDFSSIENIGVNFQYDIQYSASTKLLGKQNECDAVQICGSSFAQDHPRRKGLNHLTQMVMQDFSFLDSSSPKLKAFCWIMNNDTLFGTYNECDGTLLQRYILAYFYILQGETFDFNNFSSNATCEWPGVTCDEKNEKFVEKLILPNRNLNGFLITEIGLLNRLIEIDLHGNSLSGTISPVFFSQLPQMEYFHVGDNNFQGTIPDELFMLPNLKEANVSHNSLVGSLPAVIDKSKHLKLLDVRDNLLRGSIPNNLYKCEELEWIDLSRNRFFGTISSEIGNLRELKIIKVNENIISGSIPSTMFKATTLQTLMLQSNKLTGSIPTEIGTLDFIESVHLSHNAIKGTIPTQMSNLVNLKSILLHKNFLTGTAPQVMFNQDDFEFITDCGNPSFSLQAPLECESCTKCCNSLGLCHIQPKHKIQMDVTAYLVVLLKPIALTIVFYMTYLGMKKVNVNIPDREVDLSQIYNQDSTYCLIFADNLLAWVIYAATVAIQTLLFNLFLNDLSFDSEIFMWQYIYICPENSSECENDDNRHKLGWIGLYIIVLSYLAKDFVFASRQLSKSIFLFDLRLGFSGVVLFFLTGLALVTSIIFNTALAQTNPDLIMNAVILLFINDIDEQLLGLLQSLAPAWLERRYGEIRKNMSERKNDSNDEIPDLHRTINIEGEDVDISDDKSNTVLGGTIVVTNNFPDSYSVTEVTESSQPNAIR